MTIEKLFISYSRDDQAWVRELIAGLEELEFETWFDKKIHASLDWWEVILDNIESADYFIIILTPKSMDSEFCKAELQYALDLNKPILPIMLKKTDLPETLQSIQWLDLTNHKPMKDVLLKLATTFKVLSGKKTLARKVERPNKPEDEIDTELNEKAGHIVNVSPIDDLVNIVKRLDAIESESKTLIRALKIVILTQAVEKLKSLYNDSQFDTAFIDVNPLTNMVDNMQKNDKLIGITNWSADRGWWGTMEAERFLDSNKRAVDRGASITRIFVCEKANDESIQNEMHKHQKIGVNVFYIQSDRILSNAERRTSATIYIGGRFVLSYHVEIDNSGNLVNRFSIDYNEMRRQAQRISITKRDSKKLGNDK